MPGLLGPLPGMEEPGFPRVVADAAETLLARGRRVELPAADLEATLFRLFAVDTDPARDLPVAPVRRLADTGERDEHWWLCADPVHLEADQNRLMLFDSHTFALERHEAAALAQEFNALFAADGVWLETPHPVRWYLRLPAEPDVRTHPLSRVVGHDIHAFLPWGAAQRRWHAFLNEVQMFLHGSAVNQAREEAGRPTINSVWFWGGGVLPRAASAPFTAIWSGHALAAGLARLAGVPLRPVPPAAVDWLAQAEAPGEHLVVLEDVCVPPLYGDVPGWIEALARLERHWFAPLVQALKQGAVDNLDICPGTRDEVRVRAGDLRRFWRRRRPLTAWMRQKEV